MSRQNYKIENVVGLGLLIAAAIWYFGGSGRDAGTQGTASSKTAAPAETWQAEYSTCVRDLTCWASKWQAAAGRNCGVPIERLAKLNFKWTNRTFEPRLPRATWLNKDTGTLTYVGDGIEFQNGFGAWIIHTYECDYDPLSARVIAVRARPGQM